MYIACNYIDHLLTAEMSPAINVSHSPPLAAGSAVVNCARGKGDGEGGHFCKDRGRDFAGRDFDLNTGAGDRGDFS